MSHDFIGYTAPERAVDATLHLLALAAAAVGSLVLALAMPWPPVAGVVAPLALYVLGLLGMLGSSALYNAAAPGRRKGVLRRIDQAVIFVMIAGTYTPMVLLGSEGLEWLLVVVWVAALGGAVLTLALGQRVARLSILFYLALGWCGFLLVRPISSTLPPGGVWLLLAGGLCYSFGIVMHLAHRLRFHNALWHVMVIAGATCHYIVVFWLTERL